MVVRFALGIKGRAGNVRVRSVTRYAEEGDAILEHPGHTEGALGRCRVGVVERFEVDIRANAEQEVHCPSALDLVDCSGRGW